MGGAVALHTGIKLNCQSFLMLISHLLLALVSPYTFAGVLALSAWLPLLTRFPSVSFII